MVHALGPPPPPPPVGRFKIADTAAAGARRTASALVAAEQALHVREKVGTGFAAGWRKLSGVVNNAAAANHDGRYFRTLFSSLGIVAWVML